MKRFKYIIIISLTSLNIFLSLAVFKLNSEPKEVVKTEKVFVRASPLYDAFLLNKLRLDSSFDFEKYSDGIVKYDGFIERAEEDYAIDRFLIEAIITIESGWNERAESPEKARGLMQVLEGSFDPEKSILSGTAILRRNLDAFDNNILMALTAYNAGAGAARKMKKPNQYAYKVLKMWFYLTVINLNYAER